MSNSSLSSISFESSFSTFYFSFIVGHCLTVVAIPIISCIQDAGLELGSRSNREVVKIDLWVKDWGDKQGLKGGIEWWSQSQEPRTKSRKAAGWRQRGRDLGQYWDRKQSEWLWKGGKRVESWISEDLLNVLGNLDKRGSWGRQEILSHTCFEDHTREDRDGAMWLVPKSWDNIVAQADCQSCLDPIDHKKECA